MILTIVATVSQRTASYVLAVGVCLSVTGATIIVKSSCLKQTKYQKTGYLLPMIYSVRIYIYIPPSGYITINS